MKIERLETHDRLIDFKKKQETSILQGFEDCLKNNIMSLVLQSKSPYIYIFAHPRTHDDGVTKRFLWQPRLSKPKSQTNSYLFRVKSNSDISEICWMLPPKEMWEQYQTGKICENEIVMWSIDQFVNNREELDKPHPEDLDDKRAKEIFLAAILDLKHEHEIRKRQANDLGGFPFVAFPKP